LQSVASLCLNSGDEGVYRLGLNFALFADIFEHAACEPWFGSAESNGGKMTKNDISVAKRNGWRWDFTGNHFLRVIEEILIVWRAAGVANNQAHTRPASGSSAALGIVVRTRRDVAEHDGVQASNINAHFHSRRAGKDVERRFCCGSLESVLQVHPFVVGNLGCVFVRHQGSEGGLAHPAHRAMLFNVRVRPSHCAAVAAGTGRARLRSGQGPGTDVAVEAVSGRGQVKSHNLGVKLARSSTFPEAEYVGDCQEITAPEKLKKSEAIVFVCLGSTEPSQKVIGQSLETWGATAAAGDAPSVADGQASGGSKGVSVWDGVACVING